MKVSRSDIHMVIELLEAHYTETLQDSIREGDSEVITTAKLYPIEKLINRLVEEIKKY